MNNLIAKKELKRISSRSFFLIIITISVLVGGFVIYYERYLIDDFSDFKMVVKPVRSGK